MRENKAQGKQAEDKGVFFHLGNDRPSMKAKSLLPRWQFLVAQKTPLLGNPKAKLLLKNEANLNPKANSPNHKPPTLAEGLCPQITSRKCLIPYRPAFFCLLEKPQIAKASGRLVCQHRN